MRNFVFILISVTAIGCTSYSQGDLNGKWELQSNTVELWISDTLAISFDIENQLMNTYSVEYDQQVLTLTYIDHMKSSAPIKMKVISLTNTKMKTEPQHPNPDKRKVTVYQKISNDLPEILADDEMNWLRYKEYMRSKLDSH